MKEIKLSPIKYVDPATLKQNPHNEKYFSPVSGQELDALAADIKKRGVLNPLIAKKDGTLLAGHRRRTITILSKIKKVPVQYITEDMTDEEEIEYLLKDNLLRRHLNPEERRKLYNIIIDDFEEKVQNKHSKICGVNSRELSEKTGLNPKTIDFDLTKIRREHEARRISKSVVDVANEKEIEIYKKAVARMLNVASLGSLQTCKEYLKITNDAAERLKTVITNIEFREQGKRKAK